LKWSRLDCLGPFRKTLTSRDHENECAQVDRRDPTTAANGMVRGEEDFEEPVGSPRVAS